MQIISAARKAALVSRQRRAAAIGEPNMANATEKFLKALKDVEAHAQKQKTRGREFSFTFRAVDVRAIRTSLNLTQEQFARRYGFSIDTLRHWEQGRRQPDGPARILLKIIESKPKLVEEMLNEHVTT